MKITLFAKHTLLIQAYVTISRLILLIKVIRMLTFHLTGSIVLIVQEIILDFFQHFLFFLGEVFHFFSWVTFENFLYLF